jgi:hypothetical protein
VITIVLLPQEGDANKSIVDADKPVTTSNVMNKVIKVAIEEDHNLKNVM